MPAAIIKGRLLTKCDICGKDNASFGFGVNLRRAMNELANKRVENAKRQLGRWYCNEHKANNSDKSGGYTNQIARRPVNVEG